MDLFHSVVLDVVGEVPGVFRLQDDRDEALADASGNHIGTAVVIVLGAQDLDVGDDGAHAGLGIRQLEANVLQLRVVEGIGSLGH